MSPQSIVCATCAATVPYGRLSCPACGELLASVAGADRPARTGTATSQARGRAPDVLTAPAVPATSGVLTAPAVPATPAVLMDVAPVSTTDAPFVAEEAAPDDRGPAIPDHPVPHEDLDASPVARPADHAWRDASAARTDVPFRSVPDAPGAYVPPILVTEPAGAPAPARAWGGQGALDAAASNAETPRSSIARELLDAGRVTEFVGWLAVAGSAMAAVGFLLPWGISVIGASGVGYFDRWGLAGPFHPIVLLSLLALLGLSLVRNPIPLWLRVGVPGLGLGALLLGLTWPYIVALSGTGPGALVVAVGALVLVAAGVVALANDRHAHEDQAV